MNAKILIFVFVFVFFHRKCLVAIKTLQLIEDILISFTNAHSQWAHLVSAAFL